MTASNSVVDSWAWVELFKGTMGGKRARDSIERSDEVFTPSLVLAELARKYLREGEGLGVIRRWLTTIAESTRVVEIDIPIAEESAKAFLQLVQRAREEGLETPGLGDAIVLATARTSDALVVTGDPHFKGLPETLWIGD